MLDMKIGKRRLLTAMGAAVVLAAVTGPEAWAADAKGDPEQWIVEISNKILADIRTDAQLSQADPARVRRLSDRSGVRPPRNSARNSWICSESS